MSNFHSPTTPDEILDAFCQDHQLPLDWNEDLSLEEYLAGIDAAQRGR